MPSKPVSKGVIKAVEPALKSASKSALKPLLKPLLKPTRASRSPLSAPVARFRMRVTNGAEIMIGPGKIALLEAIEETGSITAAAKHLGMSYRRAWLLMDSINHSLKRPAVDTAVGGERGGGTRLTDTGRQVIDLYRRIEANAARATASELKVLMSLLAH
jgi:molybdate transport system regulatory protein